MSNSRLLRIGRIVILAAAAVFVVGDAARAKYYITYSGIDLLHYCSGRDLMGNTDGGAKDVCLAYVAATMDMYAKLRTFDAIADERFLADYCIPEGGVSSESVRVAILRYLQTQSDARLRSEAGVSLVMIALSKNWPCQ